jgi:hypothetical protein
MAVSYRFVENILRLDLVGVYPPDDIFNAFDRALEDPRFPPKSARFLIDVTRSESLADRSVDDLRRIAEYFASRSGRLGRRCAILAESAVHFGLMRMAVVFAEMSNVEARVFKVEDEALLWLNRDVKFATEKNAAGGETDGANN